MPIRPAIINPAETNPVNPTLLRKLHFLRSRIRVMFSLVSHRFRSKISKINRATKIAVNIDIKIPRINVTEKPLICSVPITYRTIAVISVVTLASTIVVVALSKPFRIAILSAAPRSSSSRILSNTRTLASTDIPTVNTRPASPVRVSGWLIAMTIARIKIKFSSSAMVATIPAKR